MDRLRWFRQGLKEDGYVERENVVIEYENSVDLPPELTAENTSANAPVSRRGKDPEISRIARRGTTPEEPTSVLCMAYTGHPELCSSADSGSTS
jgi:hypothetical protein